MRTIRTIKNARGQVIGLEEIASRQAIRPSTPQSYVTSSYTEQDVVKLLTQKFNRTADFADRLAKQTASRKKVA